MRSLVFAPRIPLSAPRIPVAVVKVADDVRGHSTDSLIHKDHVDVVTVALIHFVALIHGWFTADSHWFTDSHWFCGLDSHWFILWPWFTLIHWFRMLFCGLDSLIQDAVFVALIHWQGMMSWNSDNFDNSGRVNNLLTPPPLRKKSANFWRGFFKVPKILRILKKGVVIFPKISGFFTHFDPIFEGFPAL